MNHILALSDFSDISEASVYAAFLFARQYGCDLHILHQLLDDEVFSFDLNGNPNDASVFSANLAAVHPLKKWKDLALQFDIATRCKLVAAPLEEAVSQATKRIPYDLVVMGATGASQRKDNYYWGAHTQKVVSSVDSSVLVVNRPIQEMSFKNIVFASSFDQEEKEVFFYFLDLIDPHPAAVIHLLSIDTMSYFSQPTIIVQQAMRDFAKLAAGRNIKLHFYEDSSIAKGIRHFIEDVEADLLVMSHKFDKPLRHILRGDHTLRMIDQAKIPVLSIDYQ